MVALIIPNLTVHLVTLKLSALAHITWILRTCHGVYDWRLTKGLIHKYRELTFGLCICVVFLNQLFLTCPPGTVGVFPALHCNARQCSHYIISSYIKFVLLMTPYLVFINLLITPCLRSAKRALIEWWINKIVKARSQKWHSEVHPWSVTTALWPSQLAWLLMGQYAHTVHLKPCWFCGAVYTLAEAVN